jgi:hypothetical protein
LPPGIAAGKALLVAPPKTPLKVVANVTENGAAVPGVTVTLEGFGVHVVRAGNCELAGQTIVTVPPKTLSGVTLKLNVTVPP